MNCSNYYPSRKPTPYTQVLQSLQGQLKDNKFFINSLKLFKLFNILYSFGRIFQILGQRCETLCSIINSSYKRYFKMINISQVIAIIYFLCKNITNILWRSCLSYSCFNLNLPAARVWIFQWCIEAVPSYIKNSS